MNTTWSEMRRYDESGRRICGFPGCINRHNARGLCQTHDAHLSQGKELAPLRPRRVGCLVDGCKEKHHANGYCAVHNARHRSHGDPLKTVRPTPEHSFWTRVDKTDGCWVWRGGLYPGGYGHISSRVSPVPSKARLAHRVAYEMANGPIPDGLHIDHKCRNRACVRPEHLEAVTPEENTRRGLHGVLRTHCKNGHEMTPENTYYRPNMKNGRACRSCAKVWEANSARGRERAERMARRAAMGLEPVRPWPEGGREYVRSVGLNESTVNSRLRRGMAWEEAISRPTGPPTNAASIRSQWGVAGVGER